jgi:hypothetical protein
MDEDTPAERARLYAEGARKNYEGYSSLAPMVALCCDTKVLMAMAYGATDDQPTQFGQIVIALAGRFRPHTIVTVCEGWRKAYQPEESSEAEKIERGDLGRMAAAGDTTVTTSLMVNAWRLDPTESYAILDTVTAEPPRRSGEWSMVRGRKPVSTDFAYTRDEIEGPLGGHMQDVVIAAWKLSIDNPPPEDIDDMHLLKLLGTMQLVTSVSIQEWDDDQPASD